VCLAIEPFHPPEPTVPSPVGERRYVGLCDKCRGVGNIPYGAASRTCEKCKGSGNIYENVVPSPDNAADRARDVIADWYKLAYGLPWDKAGDDQKYFMRVRIERLLAALDRAGLEVRAKEDVT
jgi:hypothetical protein